MDERCIRGFDELCSDLDAVLWTRAKLMVGQQLYEFPYKSENERLKDQSQKCGSRRHTCKEYPEVRCLI